MKNLLSVMKTIFLVGGIFLAVIYGGYYLSLSLYRTFGPQFESTRTDVYRESKSYVEGTVRDLREMRVEYEKASPEHKDALRSLILQRSRELDWDRLPSDVRRFLESLGD